MQACTYLLLFVFIDNCGSGMVKLDILVPLALCNVHSILNHLTPYCEHC